MLPNGPAAHAPAAPVMLASMRLSPHELRLYAADGAPIALERKAFDLLAFLVAERHRVVGKDELLQAVWGRSIASDSVIAQAVSKARKALAGGGGRAEWIDVERGVGYRYIGPAQVLIPTEADAAGNTGAYQPPVPPRPTMRWAIAAVLLLSAGAGLGAWWQQRAALRDPLRIAVLEWRNDTGDSAFDWTRFGLQGLLVDALASDRRVVPVGQANVRALLAARPDLADANAQAEYLGMATGAQHVLAGRISRDGDGIHVELVALGRDGSDSLLLRGDDAAPTALAAGTGLTRQLLPGFDPERPRPLSADAFANEAYARGVDARMRGDAPARGRAPPPPPPPAAAAQHLQAAVAADPAMLAARQQLAVAYQLLRRNDDWRSTLDELLALALARGDRTHEGMALAGQGVLAWREGHLDDAESLFRAAGERFDGASDLLRRAAIEGNLGNLAAMRADFDGAEAAMRRALAAYEHAGHRVDVARISKNLGIMNFDRGRLDEAARWIERSLTIRQSLRLERDLAESLVAMASIDLARERPAAAQASYESAAAIFAQFKDPLLESDTLARLVNALVAQGRVQAATEAASRSLAAGRLVDNAAAVGLAHLKLAEIARLRGDAHGALDQLAQAEAQYRRIDQNQQGLVRITLERAGLAAAPQRMAAMAMVDEALRTSRERGYRVLEAEALMLRAHLLGNDDETSARAALAQAYELAQASGDNTLLTRVACATVRREPIVATSTDSPALARCTDAGMRNPDASAALAHRAEASGDEATALTWWSQRKTLAGETWTAADETRLVRLQESRMRP